MADSISEAPHRGYRVVREQHPMPGSRQEMLALISDLINAGGVLRMVVQTNHPILVNRAVQETGENLPEEVPDDDLLAGARNAEMEDLALADETGPLEYIFQAFRVISARRLRARAVFVNKVSDLRDWLHLPRTAALADVFGVEVRVHGDMPEDSLLIVATPPDVEDMVVFSLRLEMDLPGDRRAMGNPVLTQPAPHEQKKKKESK